MYVCYQRNNLYSLWSIPVLTIDSVLEKKDSNGQDLILVPNENETEIRGLMTVMQKAVHDNRF